MENKEQELENGRLLFAQEAKFMLSVNGMENLPITDLQEVAFAGRSNVGKSSLINALTNRKSLAITANYPGRTQMLNYFDLGNQVILVDMPGYGFAKAPKSAIKMWTRLIFDYLKGRANLRRVFILIDARHGIKELDDKIMKELDKAAVVFQIILTKADKTSAKELEKTLAKVKSDIGKYTASYPEVIITSSQEGTGIEDLRAEIARFAQ